MWRAKVMLIDDSVPFAEHLASALERAEIDLVVRTTAIGTAAALARERPTLAIVGAELPLLSSPEIAESIRATAERHTVELWLASERSSSELGTLVRACGAAAVVARSTVASPLPAIRRFLTSRASVPAIGESRRGRLPEVLVAARPATRAWARHLLRVHAIVRGTDSGTEALGRMTAKDPPAAVLLGSGLLDLPAIAAWSHATRVDARWRRRIIVVEEDEREALDGPIEMLRWTPGLPESVVLSWLGLAPST